MCDSETTKLDPDSEVKTCEDLNLYSKYQPFLGFSYNGFLNNISFVVRARDWHMTTVLPMVMSVRDSPSGTGVIFDLGSGFTFSLINRDYPRLKDWLLRLGVELTENLD